MPIYGPTHQHYSDPDRSSDPHALPNIETFHVTSNANGEDLATGWYWQACLPGCMPDGEPEGPFDTQAEAVADAQDY